MAVVQKILFDLEKTHQKIKQQYATWPGSADSGV